MGDLQNTNFNSFPDFTEQEAGVLQQSIKPPATPSPTSGNETHGTDDEYRDLFEPDTAIPSIEPSTPNQVKNENAEAFASNDAAYAVNNQAPGELLMPAHVDGLKNESADPALFSTEDMDAIFGKSSMFDDAFRIDDSYKLDASSPLPWTIESKQAATHTLASPFKPDTKLDFTYVNGMRVSSDEQLQAHAPPLHPQQHMQAPRHNGPQGMYPDYANASMTEEAQMAVCRFPDGRRRSHTVPPEIRLGMRPSANMSHAHHQQQQHTLRQQQSPQQLQFHRVRAEHRHHPITPPPPHMRHHVPVHGFGRGQPVFHRQIEPRGRQVSPEPKRKRQKVGHQVVEAPVREPVTRQFETAELADHEFESTTCPDGVS
ncbi:hypothetical protein E2P81_ATG06380 [Venturia nashicola]|nr:hypothetical protein E2P81_ATG06380 [Venturia nashicola]